MSKKIMIEVAYALPDKQIIIPVLVAEGISVKEGIELSGVLTKFEGIDLSSNLVGIFGKLTTLDKTLRNLDRIEIYRPLAADPKEIRRKRAAEGKEIKKGN
jgi:putative ubiquitin-RnfH superfamily antitoxin RatB of RatAB toxin-antitoxin module